MDDKKIDFVDFFIILGFSLLADVAEIIADLVGLISAAPVVTVPLSIMAVGIGWFIGFFVDGILLIYFYLKGYGNIKYLIASLIEKIPVASWLPIRTITVFIIYFGQKAEEEIGEIAKVAEVGAEAEVIEEGASMAKKSSFIGKLSKYVK